MQRKKEIEMLIARYNTDIAALEEREEDLIRQSDILENLIPNVLVSYMGKVVQTSQDKPFPENEIETEVRGKLEHLKSVLKELQVVVGLVKEEKSIMRKRIEELELFLAEQQDKFSEKNIDIDTPVRVPTRLPEKTNIYKIDEQKTKDTKTEGFDNQQGKFKELLQSENTDWKKVYEDLQKQVIELTGNLNNSSQKLTECKCYIKNLEEKYSKLKKDLQAQVQMLEKKSDSLSPDDVIDKEPGENLQVDHGSKDITSDMHESLPKNTSGTLKSLPEITSNKVTEPAQKPGILDEKQKTKTDPNIEKFQDQQVTPDKLLQPKNTNLENVGLKKDLKKQVIDLTENFNSSSQKLKESEGYLKNLGEEYDKLKKELKTDMLDLEKKADSLILGIVNKEQEKTAKRNSQDLIGKSLESYDTVSGVRSMKKAPMSPKYKVELHIHLDGAVRTSTAWELARKKNIKIPGIDSFIQFEATCRESSPTTLGGFLKKFALFWPPFLGDLDAIERVAYEFCEDESYAGVIYAEARYSPRLALGDKAIQQLGPDALDEVIVRVSHGLQRGERDFGVKTKQILCAQYSEKFNDLAETLRLCQKHYDKGVVGIDLLTLQPPEGVIDEAPFVEPIISVYREAYQTGVHRTVHAAEVGTPQAVERAVYKLGSERVGHGYHVLGDQALYQRCIQDEVHFECCPYSSLMTGSVHAWGEEHPICRFAKDGLNFSINADDPTVTGHTVMRDYELLACWGVDPAVVAQSNINACKSSFQSDSEKNDLLNKLIPFSPDSQEVLYNGCIIM